MYSFYVFEESPFQGGDGAGNMWVLTSLPRVRDVVLDFLRTAWNPHSGGTLGIHVYQRGEKVAVRDLYPFLSWKLPGLTEITWDAQRRVHGGEPEPVGGYGLPAEKGVGAPERRCRIWPAEKVVRPDRETSLEVRVDWAGMRLPELVSPLLPEGTGVVVDGRELAYDPTRPA